MSEFVSLWHGGLSLSVHRDVAKALGHRDGARLTEAEAWEALSANCKHMIRVCNREIEARKAQ